MSEKRFTSNERWIAEGTIVDICDNGKVIMQVFDDDNIQNVVDLLNEQQATIKSKDKQLERLYNYFQDYLKDEMSGNAFSEMWDFVKEDEKWEDE